MTRRDQCYFVGKRAYRLHPIQAAYAWYYISGQLEAMGEMDIPKFRHLLQMIRRANILAARADTTSPISHPLYESTTAINSNILYFPTN